MSTSPADRTATEEAIASIYARHGRARPSFRWVPSPHAALPHLAGLPTHETLCSWLRPRPPAGAPPLAGDIAAGLSHLRSALAAEVTEPPPDRPPMKRVKEKPWPRLSPSDALDQGLPFLELLRQGIYEALFRSLAEGVYLPLRAALLASSDAFSNPAAHPRPAGWGPVNHSGTTVLSGRPQVAGAGLPVGWYGQQDAAWIAHLDVLRRLGLVPAAGGGSAFESWATLARSGGWWWPGEDRCVLVERPVVIRTEPVPYGLHDEVRLCRDHDKPAVEYRDGWTV